LPEQLGDVERTCADITKAKRLLDYSPRISFEEGIARTVEWYRVARYQVLHDSVIDITFMLDPGSTRSYDTTDLRYCARKMSFSGDDEDELELNSFVEKAPHQYPIRRSRYVPHDHDDDEFDETKMK
jgi:hypothetical protein